MSVPEGGELGLSDAWRAWLADELLRGVPADRLRASLLAADVPAPIAARELAALLASPLLAAARRQWADRDRLALVLRLRRELAAAAPDLPRHDRVDAATLMRDCFAANRPAVFTRAASDWPALTRWTPARLAACFGDAQVEVEVDRAAAPNHEGRYVTMTLGDFLARAADDEGSNDLYCIARNRNIARPALAPLLDDIVVDEALFDPARVPGGASLWIGPRGTLTPFHHDTTNILMHQIVGRKHFTLVSPDEVAMLPGLRGFYTDIDPAAAGARTFEVTLSPGEALFIPVGWYHRVEALDLSVSFSLLCFRRPNDFSWYEPGRADR